MSNLTELIQKYKKLTGKAPADLEDLESLLEQEALNRKEDFYDREEP